MDYVLKYRLLPTTRQRELLDWVRDTVRQVYNHALHRFNRIPETTGTVRQRVLQVRDELPDLKDWWSDLTDVYSTVLQQAVEQIETNINNLGKLKDAGYNVGSLNWKAPHEYRSFTYRQRGFELDEKIGDIPITFHRDLPDDASIKTVTVKREPTGKWYASLGVETPNDPPEKPDEVTNAVGIDVGILKYVHDSDGTAVESPDLSDERERLERAQRNLSRKEHGSNNWEKQRKTVARRHADLKRKRRDFLHKLSGYYASEYDLVAVEDLDAKGLVELPGNSRNRAGASWGTFLRMLEYKCEREGTHFVAVDPRGTTKECASCGVETDKPLWVREHSCPSCGLEADRDANASWNILSRGLEQVGTGCPESTSPEIEDFWLANESQSDSSTPVETALPTDTDSVSAKRVVEAGSPTLKERTASAVSE